MAQEGKPPETGTPTDAPAEQRPPEARAETPTSISADAEKDAQVEAAKARVAAAKDAAAQKAGAAAVLTIVPSAFRTAMAYAFGVRIMTPSITAWPPTIKSLSLVLMVCVSVLFPSPKGRGRMNPLLTTMPAILIPAARALMHFARPAS